MSEDLRKQMIYLSSLDIIRRMLRDGIASREVLERLNRRNAESMDILSCGYGKTVAVTYLSDFVKCTANPFAHLSVLPHSGKISARGEARP